MLKDEIQKAVFTSLKEGKKTEVKVLRFIMSEIKYAEISKRDQLTDEEVRMLIRKEIKKRKEANEMFKKGGRTDLVIDEEKQISILNQYLPKQLSTPELNKIIDDVLVSTTDIKNIGKVIGAILAKVKGRTDNATVIELIKQKIEI